MSAALDEDDVARVLAGDLSAFEGIVRRWQGPLVNLAYRFCRDRGRSEEMAQEAFLRAFRALSTWRRDAAFSTWLFALATNLCRSELRRIPPPSLRFDQAPEIVDPRSTDAELEAASRARAVVLAVDALPPKYREALIIYYFHEQGVPATARSLNLPEGTVKARLFRGRELLRRKLSRFGVASGLKEA